jgi:hypothetical protein
MTDEMKIARRVQKNLRLIGIASEITMKDDMTVVCGTDRRGEPFACAAAPTWMSWIAFADECDELRTNPHKSGDLILVCQSDA